MVKTTPEQMKLSVGAVVGFLVFVELTSGFVQGYYLPLFAVMARNLGVTDADMVWFNAVQTLAAGVCVPILSKLGDIFGHRLILRVAIASVFLGTLITALSTNYPLVLVGRFLVGPLAVWLPLEIALVHNRITGATGRRAIGMLVSALTVGVVLGGLAGGAMSSLTDSMLIVLLVPAIVAGACLVIVFTLVPESTVRSNPKIDLLGFALLALAMLVLLWGLRQAQALGFTDPTVIGLLVLAAVLVSAFIWWELRVDVPAVNVRLIGSRSLAPIYLMAFVYGMVVFGTQTLMTTFFATTPAEAGYGFGLDAGVLGILIAGWAVAAAVAAGTFALFTERFGELFVLYMGAAVTIVAHAAMALVPNSVGVVVTAYLVAGLGAGFLLGVLPSIVADLSPPDETGIATGVYNSMRTLGGSAAGAVFGVVLTAYTVEGAQTVTQAGYVAVWIVCAALYALALGILIILRRDIGAHIGRQADARARA